MSRAIQATGSVFMQRTRGQRLGPITRLISPGDRLAERLKPFVFLDAVDIQPDGPFNFDWHPHSGIATVTIHFDGESWTEESDQSIHALPAGGVEWVCAGRGIWHRGGVKSGHPVRGFQLWLALGEDEELQPGASEYYQPPQLPSNGTVRVILGEFDGMRSPVPAPPNVTYLQLSLETDQQVALVPRPEDVAFVAALRGQVEVLGSERRESIEGPELGVLGPSEGPVVLVARAATQLIYGAAPPHPHELVLGKHSVHTSRSALRRGEGEIARIWAEGVAAGR